MTREPNDRDEGTALDTLLDRAEQDASEQMAQVSDWFWDRLVKETEKFPEEEGKVYSEQACYLFSKMKGYGNPHFLRNFFDYLFDKTEDMEDQLKRRFVLVAYSVYDSTAQALDRKIMRNKDDDFLFSGIDSLFGMIWPETRFADLGFDRNDYENLRESLNVRIKPEVMKDPRFDKEFYGKETIAEVAELIYDINPLA